MIDLALAASPAFSRSCLIRNDDISLDVRDDLTIASIASGRNKGKLLNAAILGSYGIELPTLPQRIVGPGGLELIWNGPHQWLMIAPRDPGRDLEHELLPVVAGLGAVTDQSDARVVIRVSGRRARDLLAKGVTINLEPAAFSKNAVAITYAFSIGVVLCQHDATPTYDLVVFRSFADSLARRLRHSAEQWDPVPA